MKLRVLESHWNPFINSLCERSDVETAGIVLAERLRGGEVLLARHLIPMPEQGYIIRRSDQLRLDPITLNRTIRPARDGGLSVITVHTHPHSTRPWFSTADDHGDSRLMPSLLNQMPGPHGSMVIAGQTGLPIGRLFFEDGLQSELETRIVGPMLHLPPQSHIGQNAGPWFDRQRLALGDAGQDILRRLHIVIIGLGGTGSVCFAQVAHLGVGRITIIDGDLVDDSNVSRILGATINDVGRTYKVDVAAHYAQHLGLGTQVRCLKGHLGRDIPVNDIEGADITLSCVDRHLPRALLNRLSYEKAIPVIDMGSAFRVDEGRIVEGAGRVVIIGPGRPCLACWGHIDSDRIRIESLPDDERERQIAEGYIEGAAVRQPSVISFNTAVAGSAVVELLRLATGFAGTDNMPMRLSFDFLTGVVRRNRLPEGTGCGICLPEFIGQDTVDTNCGELTRHM